MMFKAGQKFEHFEILSKLGEGGMGAVYLARDTKLNRKVALKTLTGELFDDQNRLERFRREARTAAQISNAYVMATYDIGRASDAESGEDVDYIVLEYVEGRSLTEFIKEERPNLSRLVRLAEKTASGLAAAHKLNIVHRDIKPENIIIDDDGDPKILDFGLAKPLDPVKFDGDDDSTQTVSQELTKVGKIIGTVSYMAPEQVRGDKVDPRSDIFSFGILLYRMVTGDMPFAGPSQVETMAKILESSFEPPRSRNEAIPPELERIITKCLRKDPEDRYQSSRDLVVDLRNLRRQSDSGVTESITDVTGVASSRKKSHTLWSVVGGVAIVVAALVIRFWDTGSTPATPRGLQAQPNSLAIIGFENKTGDAELDWLETGLPEILLTDLSANQELPIISQQRILDCFDVDKKLSHTHEECVEAAQSLGATRLLSGAFYKLGERIRIDARLEDIGSGNIVLAEKVIGDDPFMLVDSLTAKIAAALNLGETGDLQALASSPEAFRLYHAGMEAFWSSEYDTAIVRLQEAIALDSGFALPYMRIGMANIFAGRNAAAAQYFMMARERQERLPLRERSLLDAYIDTWVNQNFDHAFAKLETLVRDYPEDAEIRTIYALFINAFQSDTTAAFAQLDTVLVTYPTNAFAIEQYATLLRGAGNNERAAYYVVRLAEVLPNAMAPQIDLVQLRQRQERWQEAMDLASDLRERFPSDPRPLYRLVSISLNLRNFEDTREYAEKIKALKPDDPYNLIDYYSFLANIDTWKGKFRSSVRQLQNLLEQARLTGDSAQVFQALNSLGAFYLRYEMKDSMRVTETEAFEYARGFNRISYPLTIIAAFPEEEPEVRPVFDEIVNDMRARTPQQFWGVIAGVEMLFDGLAESDTAVMADGLRAMVEESGEQAGANVFELGQALVLNGDFAEGKAHLMKFLEGEYRSNNAWRYLSATHYVGRAEEGLGNKAEAIRRYEEILQYWGEADIQVEAIREAKEHLARLTS